MAAYPTVPMQRDGSMAEREGGITPQRASNGLLKVRRMYSADKRRFQAVHWAAGAALASLRDHYAADRNNSFSMVWPHDGATYTVVYAAAPQEKLMDGYTIITNQLLEV